MDTNDPPNHILSIRGTVEITEVHGVVKEYAQAAVRYIGKENLRVDRPTVEDAFLTLTGRDIRG